MNINTNIFRAYDIRGIAGTDITAEFAELLGKAFGTYLLDRHCEEVKSKAEKRSNSSPTTTPSTTNNPRNEEAIPLSKLTVAISRDNRPHGAALESAFIKGLQSTGCNIIQLGQLPTPLLYFAVCNGSFDAGVSITASHNSAEYNGFKLVGRNAESICGDEIQKILQIMQSGECTTGVGTNNHLSLRNEYKNYMVERTKLSRPLKIVVDCANGIAGQIYPDIFRALGCKVIELYCESDGTFPNHEPDPIVEANLTALKESVKEYNADLGLAFDGDGDRVSVVDNTGQFHDANKTLCLLAADILSRNQKANIVYTVSCSLIVPQEIERLGGISHMVPVGHSFVEQSMHEHKALLGGEQSGHFFIAENYYSFDDACFTTCRLLQIFSQINKPVSQLYNALPKVYDIPERRPHCSDDTKFAIVQRLSKKLSQIYPVNTMDGIRADLGEGSWVGIRASNTSPCISVIVEATSRQKLKKMNKQMKNLLGEESIKL
jgi:phosphomannomutase / phosphoglucomutase